jgi:FkbM family methyltransferase
MNKNFFTRIYDGYYIRGFVRRRDYFNTYGIILPLYDNEMYDGIYEQFKDFLPTSNKYTIDVGASNCAYSVIACNKYNSIVIAFEPLTKNYKEGLRYIKRNKSNIVLHNIGLNSCNTISYYWVKNNMLTNFNYDTTKYRTRLAYFITLDYYMLNKDYDIDLIKIDVEGFEYNVLLGSIETIKKYKPRIIIETHSINLRFKCNSFLVNLGYKLKHQDSFRYSNTAMNEVVNSFYSYGD